jgi:hypothetical protein
MMWSRVRRLLAVVLAAFAAGSYTPAAPSGVATCLL